MVPREGAVMRAATPPAHVELSTYWARQVGAGLPTWQAGLKEWMDHERASEGHASR